MSTNLSPQGDVVRVKVGDKKVKWRIGLLSRCLVGWSGKETKPRLNVEEMCIRVSSLWELRGSLKVMQWGDRFMLFEFESVGEEE